MIGRQRREARSEVEGRQEEEVAGLDSVGEADHEGGDEEGVSAVEAAGEQVVEPEEEDLDEVGADADGEVDNVPAVEVIAEEVDPAVGEQAAEQEEEDQDEVGAEAAGVGGVADREVNNVAAAEVIAEGNTGEEPAAVEAINARGAAAVEGVDPVEGETGDEENAVERA